MDFEELMYSPIMSRDIGRSFMMPQAGFGYGLGPSIYPYYGLQTMNAQPTKDTFVNQKQGKKADKIAKIVGGIVLGTLAVLGGTRLLTKGTKIATPKLSGFLNNVKTFFKNGYTKAAGAVSTGYGKAVNFLKNLFKKAPTP